jgi:hypothetical protein
LVQRDISFFALEKLSQHHKGHHMNSLTSREGEIDVALAERLSNWSEAHPFGGTVKVHLHNIYS